MLPPQAYYITPVSDQPPGAPDHGLPGQPPTVNPGPGSPTHPIAPGGGPSQGPGFPTHPIAPGGPPPTVGGGPITPPPTVGGGPIVPDLPPGHPVQPLPPGHAPVVPPGSGVGKPPGVPIIGAPPDAKPPMTPPQPPGTWVNLDGGKGEPPAWGYVPQGAPVLPDHGLPGGPPVAMPAGGAPPAPGPSATGHWVAIGSAAPPSQPDPKGSNPVWAWVPHIDATYGTKVAQPK
jgi:hypothetical protein